MLTDFYSDLAAVFQYKYMYNIRYFILQYHNLCVTDQWCWTAFAQLDTQEIFVKMI